MEDMLKMEPNDDYYSPAVQSGRPPGVAMVEPKLNEVPPLLSPLTEVLAKTPLQQYSCRVDTAPIPFRLRALELLRRASRLRDALLTEKSESTLSSPFSILSANVVPSLARGDQIVPPIIRSPSHRPTPSSYRAAISLFFLRNLSLADTTASSTIHPPAHESAVQALFPSSLPHLTSETSTPREAFTDQGAFLDLCTDILPRGTHFAVTEFVPHKAVVFAVNKNRTIQCIAGWARWSALLAVQASLKDGVRMKISHISEKVYAQLTGPVPVYLIDGSDLTSYDLVQLSTALNVMDIPSDTNLSFATTPRLENVRSRPLTLLCRLWTLQLIVTNLTLSQHSNNDAPLPTMPFIDLLLETIEAVPSLMEFRAWLLSEADNLLKSLWVRNPLVFPKTDTTPTLRDGCSVLLSFLLSLSWPLNHNRIASLSLPQLRSLLGSDFPFGPMSSPGTNLSRCTSFFWDDLLTHHMPYQIQVIYTLADLMGVIRTLEIFFQPRSLAQNRLLLDLHWISAENVSLVNHFARSDTARAFVERIVTNSAFRSIAPASSWAFEHLSSFICLYHLHFLYELEGQLSAQGDGRAPPLSDSIPLEPPLVTSPGTHRILTLVRAIATMAYFTYDSPSQFLDFNRLGGGESPHVLTIPPPAKGDVKVLNQLTYPIAGIAESPEERKVGEEYFELLIGMISELVIRVTLAGVTRDVQTPNLASRGIIDVLKARRSNQETLSVPRKETLLPETLRAGALLLQTFLKIYSAQIWRLQAREIVALFPSTDPKQQFQSISIHNLLDARQKMYELITRSLARIPGLVNCSHYQFVWSILEPLTKKNREEAAEHAQIILCGVKKKEQKVQLLRSTPSPPLMTLSAPNLDPQSHSAEEVWKRVSEVARNRGMTQGELLSRVCAQRSVNGGAAATLDLLDLSSKMQRSTSKRAPAEAQQRITHWFEQRTSEARSLLSSIFKAMQAAAGGPNPPVTISADFRGMTPEEAKEAAGPLSDLSQDSTNVSSSLHEIPYQLQVEDVSVLPFAQESLTATCEQIEYLLQSHLADGLKQLLMVKEPGHSVVCSARPAIVCALWQTLIRLSPFLDVLHPLALHWNEVRALFCSWLWKNVRSRLDAYWATISRESLGPGEDLPTLRWSMRCLPSDQDHNYLASLPDLTAERLRLLLDGPRLLDRICAAFYRFQCSGMANAKAALGNAQMLAPTAENLNKIFSSNENCLKDVFSNLWERVHPGTTVEDALHNPDIAAACFLKRYAPYVLSGLESQDKIIEGASGLAPGMEAGIDTEEPASKRRRRDMYVSPNEMADGDEGNRLKRVQARGAELPSALILGTAAVQNLKRELRQKGVAGKAHRRPGGKTLVGDDKSDDDPAPSPSEPAVWLQTLPLALRERLNRALPTDHILQIFEEENAQSHSMSDIDGVKGTRQSDNQDQLEEPQNGIFPSLPDWLETTPAWTLWQPPTRKGDTVGSPWHNSEDAIAIDRVANITYQKLSPHSSSVRAASLPDLSERDWELIRCTLACLSNRGIDMLYSSSTSQWFSTNSVRFAEIARDLDEQAEAWGSSPPLRQPPSSGCNSLVSLRRYLDGWSVPEQIFSVQRGDDFSTNFGEEELYELANAIRV